MTKTFLVVGCGSIGTRHLANLRRLRAGRLLAAEPHGGRRRAACEASGAQGFRELDPALAEGPDAVLVCTPPSDHVAVGLRALAAGAHLFVEKPLAPKVVDAQRLVQRARRARRLLTVGYNLRFEKGLQQLHRVLEAGSLGTPLGAVAEFGQFLPTWRPRRRYRETYTARRALGGGILLDASHEIDALRWLLGEPSVVLCETRRAPHLATDVEGLADLLLRFPRGVAATVHLDFLQHRYERRLKIIGTRGTALWDYGARRLELRAPGRTQIWRLRADANSMYLAEMRAFLAALKGRRVALADGADALRTLRVVDAARRSARTGRGSAP